MAEQELLDDPERLALALIPLLRYADAYALFKRARKKELDAARRSMPMIDLVERHAHEMAEAEIAADGGKQ